MEIVSTNDQFNLDTNPMSRNKINEECCILCVPSYNLFYDKYILPDLGKLINQIENRYFLQEYKMEQIYPCSCTMPVHKLCLIKFIILSMNFVCPKCNNNYFLKYIPINNVFKKLYIMGNLFSFVFFLIIFIFLLFVLIHFCTENNFYLAVICFIDFICLCKLIFYVKEAFQAQICSKLDILAYRENFDKNNTSSTDHKFSSIPMTNFNLLKNFIQYVLKFEIKEFFLIKTENNKFFELNERLRLEDLLKENKNYIVNLEIDRAPSFNKTRSQESLSKKMISIKASVIKELNSSDEDEKDDNNENGIGFGNLTSIKKLESGDRQSQLQAPFFRSTLKRKDDSISKEEPGVIKIKKKATFIEQKNDNLFNITHNNSDYEVLNTEEALLKKDILLFNNPNLQKKTITSFFERKSTVRTNKIDLEKGEFFN